MKKVLSVFLSMVMLLSITMVADFSAYALTSGDWQYSIVSGGVSITGYKGSETELTIPSKLGTLSANVVSIGENAFKDNTDLKSIVIPDSIKSIGNTAFSGCTQLENAVIADSVTSIGSGIFTDCAQLSNVVLPETMESVSSSMFFGCTSLESITLPSNLKSIDSSAFAGCTSLSRIHIPASVTSIGMMAFTGCISLTSVVIPDGLTTIQSGVFGGCENLLYIVIPKSVTTIQLVAFAGCNALTTVFYKGTLDEWDHMNIDFSKPTTQLNGNDPLLNADIISIADNYELSENGEWTYFVDEDGNAVIVCYNGDESDIIIPSEIDGIRVIGVSSVNLIPEKNIIKNVVVSDGISIIGDSAFYGCTDLNSIVLPDSITSIGESAFEGCSSLQGIDLPDSVTSIGKSVFKNCRELKNIVLPDKLEVIGNSAFLGCYSLQNVDIPESVTSIESNAFSYCFALTEFIIPDGIEVINGYTFAFCSQLESIVIPNSVKNIETTAFGDCISLKDVYFQGTRDQWNSVDIDMYASIIESGNEPLLNATIHCMDDIRYSITVMPSALGLSMINDIEVVDDAVTLDVFENSDVTLTAEPLDGAVFTGWSVDGKLISKDAQITVKAFADITYVPVFQATNDTFTVLFADRYGNIFSTQQVTNGAEIDFDSVKAPSFAGYTFTGWSVTPEDAVHITGPVTIQAVYQKNSSQGYTVTAVGCTITANGECVTDVLENIPFDTLVTVYKQYNSAWSINGAVAAYGQSYSFYVGADVTLTPWDGPVVLAPAVAAVSVTEMNDGGKIKASFLATRYMTEDCTYISSGFVYGKNLEDDYITLANVKSDSVVKAYYSATDAEQFALTYSLSAQTGKMTARAFLVYADANGETQVIYAKPQTYTYSA